MHGIYRMSRAELERVAARAFDCGASATLLRVAERKAELRARLHVVDEGTNHAQAT